MEQRRRFERGLTRADDRDPLTLEHREVGVLRGMRQEWPSVHIADAEWGQNSGNVRVRDVARCHDDSRRMDMLARRKVEHEAAVFACDAIDRLRFDLERVALREPESVLGEELNRNLVLYA